MQRSKPLKRGKPMRRGKPMKRTRTNKKPPPHGFPEETRINVARRSGYRCEARTKACTGKAAHFHHRQLRRFKDQREVNCLHVCRACHEHIHANPSASYLMGWLVRSFDDPAGIGVRPGEG